MRPSIAIASVGQASAHFAHPSGHFDESMTGRPRYRSGKIGSSPAGNEIVRYPCLMRSLIILALDLHRCRICVTSRSSAPMRAQFAFFLPTFVALLEWHYKSCPQ